MVAVPSWVARLAVTATSTGLLIEMEKPNAVPSVADGALMLMTALSLSAMFMSWLVVVPSEIPADGFEIVNVAVSVAASTSMSSVTVNVTLPAVCPSRIVMVEFESV